MDKGLLTIRETAFYVALGESTIDRDSKNGCFPAPVYIGSNKRWRKTDVDAWIASLSNTEAKPKKETRGRKRLAV